MKNKRNNDKKRIMFLNIQCSVSGSARVLVDTVNYLCKYYDVTVLSIESGGVMAEQFDVDSGVKVKTIVDKRRPFIFKLFYYLYSKGWLKYCYRIWIRGKFDYEIAFTEGVPTGTIGMSPKRTTKIAWVHTDMLKNDTLDAAFASEEEHRKTYEKFDRIICVSDEAKSQFVKRFGISDKVTVIHNLNDREKIYAQARIPLDSEAMSKNEIFTLISVGRFIPMKGFDRLLRIAKKLKDDNLHFRLWIVGDGPEYQKYNEFVALNDLTDTVYLLGFQKNPYKYIANSSLYVCPSYIEAYSTTIIESLLLRVPVISTDCAGTYEILKGEYGVMTENDEISLYEAIKSVMLDHRQYSDLKEAITRYKSEYDRNYSDIANSLKNLFM